MSSVTTTAPSSCGPLRIHERVKAQALRRPTAVAVACEGASLTYAELDRRADAVAQRLKDLGNVDGRLVAIALERSIDMIVGLLGILKSGAAYLPNLWPPLRR